MLLEVINAEAWPVAPVVVLGLILGLVFGVAGQISRFCLRRGLVEGPDRRAALGTWLTALLFAVLGTQAIAWLGLVDFSEHRYTSASLPLVALVLGGLLFGAGMVLTRGCISRLTILGGTGNLRALLVVAIFAIVAHATLKGVLAPVRVAIGSVTVDAGDASTLAGLPGGALLWGGLLAAVLVAIIARSGARPLHMAMAAIIGLLVPLAWFGTGNALFDDFDPIPLDALSFTAPWADTLFWTIASTSITAGLGTGLVAGVLVGALASSLVRGEAQLVSFESPGQTLRYASGAALMGVGGVLAGGCTVGAGLSGVSTLSIAGGLALLSIMGGAVAADRLLNRTASQRGQAALTPAE